MSERRDDDFGRFLYVVTVTGLVVTLLGLGAIWYYFNYGTLPIPNVPNPQKMLASRTVLGPNQVMLYYTRDGKTLSGVVAELDAGVVTPTDRARTIVNMLLEGRASLGLRSAIPEGTTLHSVFVTNGLLVVNLSKEFVNNLAADSNLELLAVYSLVNSLLFNIEAVDGVQLLIEGEKVPTLRGTVDTDHPLVANQAFTRAL
ncbi:MAG: GerMN domain-containing protein [Candidatus Sumerlaeaceae bacterium]|jgi:spore germination protein GerM